MLFAHTRNLATYSHRPSGNLDSCDRIPLNNDDSDDMLTCLLDAAEVCENETSVSEADTFSY